MAYNTTTPRAEYTASVGQTVFTFLFKVFLDSDLKVYLTPSGTTPDTTADLLTLTTDYTVTINGDSGGSITLTNPTSVNDGLVLVRRLPVDRDTEYQTNGDLLASTLNNDQEYQTYLISDNQASANQHLTLKDNETGVSNIVPSPVASGYLRWNSTGTALRNDTTGQIVRDDINLTVGSIAELREVTTMPDTIYATAYDVSGNTAGAFGSHFFKLINSSATDNGGTIIVPDGVTTYHYSLQYSGAVNVKWFGAHSDGTSPSATTTGIQSAMNLLNSVVDATFIEYDNSFPQPEIYFPSGVYLVDNTIQIGTSNEITYDANVTFSKNAIIKRVESTDSIAFAVKIVNAHRCSFNNIQVQAIKCNGLLVSESFSSQYNNLGLASDYQYSFYLTGLIFNNTFINTKINQNQSLNGAEYGMYMNFLNKDSSTYYDNTGSPINSFLGFYCSGVSNAIYAELKADRSIDPWGAGALSFKSLEIEGFGVSGLTFKNFNRPIAIDSMWMEGSGTAANSSVFESLSSISITNSFLGTSAMLTLFKNCGLVTLMNNTDGGLPQFEGRIGALNINNVRLKGNYPKDILSKYIASGSEYFDMPTFDNISINNLSVSSFYSSRILTAPYDDAGKFITIITTGNSNVDSSTTSLVLHDFYYEYTDIDSVVKTKNISGIVGMDYFATANNYTIDFDIPDYLSGFTFISGSISAHSNVINTTKSTQNDYTILQDRRAVATAHLNATIADSATYNKISPLGVKENLITITGTTAPIIYVPVTTSSIATDTQETYYFVTCMREELPTPSVTASDTKYIRMASSVTPNPYGDIIYYVYKDGIKYICTASKINVTALLSTISVKINYNKGFDIGTQFVFGGCSIVKGSEMPVISTSI